MRLQKYLAECGVASRRHAEDMITQGLVQINGITVREMGLKVEEGDEVRVRGDIVTPQAEKRYVLYYTPIGEVTTSSDPEGRPTVLDRFRDFPVRLYPVGRLDFDSEGLLLLTNDGELANRLTHPSYEVPKTYVARVSGEVRPGVKRTLLAGIELEDGPIAVDHFRVLDTFGDITTVEITVHEGRNRLVRRMMDEVGYPVHELVRTQFGPIRLDHLQPGTTRRVKGNALVALYGAVGL